MSKNELCKCGKNVNGKSGELCKCDCQEVMKCGDYYLGFDEVSYFRGKKDNMQPLIGLDDKPKVERYFNQKFMRDSKRAAELVFLSNVYAERAATHDPDLIANFWKNVKYDNKHKTYIYEEYLTLGTMQNPKKCQLEEFYKGNYEFIKVRHEIQVFRTEPVKVNVAK